MTCWLLFSPPVAIFLLPPTTKLLSTTKNNQMRVTNVTLAIPEPISSVPRCISTIDVHSTVLILYTSGLRRQVNTLACEKRIDPLTHPCHCSSLGSWMCIYSSSIGNIITVVGVQPQQHVNITFSLKVLFFEALICKRVRKCTKWHCNSSARKPH